MISNLPTTAPSCGKVHYVSTATMTVYSVCGDGMEYRPLIAEYYNVYSSKLKSSYEINRCPSTRAVIPVTKHKVDGRNGGGQT